METVMNEAGPFCGSGFTPDWSGLSRAFHTRNDSCDKRFTGAAAPPPRDRLGAMSLSNGRRIGSKPRRGRRGSMKYPG